MRFYQCIGKCTYFGCRLYTIALCVFNIVLTFSERVGELHSLSSLVCHQILCVSMRVCSYVCWPSSLPSLLVVGKIQASLVEKVSSSLPVKGLSSVWPCDLCFSAFHVEFFLLLRCSANFGEQQTIVDLHPSCLPACLPHWVVCVSTASKLHLFLRFLTNPCIKAKAL